MADTWYHERMEREKPRTTHYKDIQSDTPVGERGAAHRHHRVQPGISRRAGLEGDGAVDARVGRLEALVAEEYVRAVGRLQHGEAVRVEVVLRRHQAGVHARGQERAARDRQRHSGTAGLGPDRDGRAGGDAGHE